MQEKKKMNCNHCGTTLEETKNLYLTSFPLDLVLYCPKCQEEKYIDYFGQQYNKEEWNEIYG